MSEFNIPDTTSWSGIVPVSDLSVITVTGDEAASFLHGQVSQDINGQSATQAKLAAYCSPKGRMLGSFVSLRPSADAIWLLLDHSLAASLSKRLSMFVLRAKAKVADATGSMQTLGIVGYPCAQTLGVQHDLPVWSAQPFNDGMLARLPDAQGLPRWVWAGPSSSASALLTQAPELPVEQWAWLDVVAGIPRIQQATADQFVPQMINYELIGGVNFQKGCYPGQEVVARSQYRGTTKRRAFLVHAQSALTPGQEVFSEADANQPAGMVINAAPTPGTSNQWSALIELKLAMQEAVLRAGSPEGALIQVGQLPYSLPSDDDKSV